jgi:hypothetical protein
MPPHCDSLDGPVVSAAREALSTQDVDTILPFVSEEAEDEVRAAFARSLPVRGLGPEAGEVADQLFFETVVRLHRAGEGAPYTGLKPAGLSQGPVLPLAERAVESGSAEALVDFLTVVLRDELKHRLEQVVTLSAAKDRSLADARRYVQAMLGFEVYSHHLYLAMRSTPHGDGRSTEPKAG